MRLRCVAAGATLVAADPGLFGGLFGGDVAAPPPPAHKEEAKQAPPAAPVVEKPVSKAVQKPPPPPATEEKKAASESTAVSAATEEKAAAVAPPAAEEQKAESTTAATEQQATSAASSASQEQSSGISTATSQSKQKSSATATGKAVKQSASEALAAAQSRLQAAQTGLKNARETEKEAKKAAVEAEKQAFATAKSAYAVAQKKFAAETGAGKAGKSSSIELLQENPGYQLLDQAEPEKGGGALSHIPDFAKAYIPKDVLKKIKQKEEAIAAKIKAEKTAAAAAKDAPKVPAGGEAAGKAGQPAAAPATGPKPLVLAEASDAVRAKATAELDAAERKYDAARGKAERAKDVAERKAEEIWDAAEQKFERERDIARDQVEGLKQKVAAEKEAGSSTSTTAAKTPSSTTTSATGSKATVLLETSGKDSIATAVSDGVTGIINNEASMPSIVSEHLPTIVPGLGKLKTEPAGMPSLVSRAVSRVPLVGSAAQGVVSGGALGPQHAAEEQQALKLEPITNLLQRFDAQELAEQTGATDETATDKTKTDNAEYQEAAQKKLKDTASDVLSQLGLNGLIDTASDEIHDIAKEEKKGQDAEKRTSIAKKATAAANARKAEAEKKLAALAGSQASKAPGGASVALDEKDDFVFLPVAQLRTMMAEEVATEDDDTSKVDQNAPFSRMKDLVGSVSGAFSQGGNLKDVVSKGGSSILKAAQQQTVWERERADKAEKALKAAEAEADAAEEKLKQAQSAMPATTTPPARAIPPATATSSSTATTDSSSSGFSLFGGGGGLQMLVEEPASKKDEKKADAAPAKKEEAKKEPTPKIAVVKKEDTAKSNAAKKEEKAGPADDFLNKLPGFLQPLKQFLTPGVGIVNQAAAKIEGFAAPPKDEAKKAKQSTYGIPQAVKNQLSSLPFTAMKGVGGGDSGKTGDNTIQLFQLGSFVPDGVGQFLPSGLAEDGPLRRREYQNNFVVPGAAVPDYMWEPAEESTAHSRVLSLYQPSSSDVISLKAGAPAKGAEGTGAPFRVDLKSDFLRVPSAQFLPLVTYLVGDEGLKHCFASANSIWFCRDNQDMNTALQKKHIQMTIQSDNTNFNIRVTGSQLFFSLSDADGHSIGWNMVLIRGSKSGFLVVPASVFMAKYIVGAASDRTLYVDAAAGTLRMTGAGSVSKSGVSVLFVVIPTLTVLMCLYQLVVSMNEKVVMPEPESKDLHYVRF